MWKIVRLLANHLFSFNQKMLHRIVDWLTGHAGLVLPKRRKRHKIKILLLVFHLRNEPFSCVSFGMSFKCGAQMSVINVLLLSVDGLFLWCCQWFWCSSIWRFGVKEFSCQVNILPLEAICHEFDFDGCSPPPNRNDQRPNDIFFVEQLSFGALMNPAR